MSNNKNQYALITGATSGIGYELAKLFAKDGYNLVIVARSENELDRTSVELKQQYGIDVVKIPKDLFQRNAAVELYEEISDKQIRIDILVNDAGQGQYGKFYQLDLERQLNLIHLNICSVVILTHKFLNEMVNRGEGKILNLSSIASKTPGAWQAVYHATKAFVQSFTEAVRAEVKDSGVSLTALLPGATATDFFHKAQMLNAKNIKDAELADPAEVAKDGYEALMNGDDMVVSGFKNKAQVALAGVTPDSVLAEQTYKQQAPADQH
jgi:uncharacterized protein